MTNIPGTISSQSKSILVKTRGPQSRCRL